MGQQGMERLSVDKMIDELIAREGGFTDNPDDKAHQKRRAKGDRWDSYCTNMGITQETLSDFCGRQALMHEVAELTMADTYQIYRHMYYLDPKIDRLPEPWRPLVFDWAVHSGPATAIKALQELCLGAGLDPGPIDGIIGPKTVAAARRLLAFPLLSYLAKRRDFCEAICENDPGQQVFLRGWMSRIDELEKSLA